MPDYESARRMQELRRGIAIEEQEQKLRIKRRYELQAMQSKNEPLRKKLLDRNRIDMNRATDRISLMKMELFDLEEQALEK